MACAKKTKAGEIYRTCKAIAAEVIEVTDCFVSLKLGEDSSVSDLCLGAEHAEQVAEQLRCEVLHWLMRIQPRLCRSAADEWVEWTGERMRAVGVN